MEHYLLHSLSFQPLSAEDYQQISSHFNIVLVQDLPHISTTMRTQAWQFIMLIDILYAHKLGVLIVIPWLELEVHFRHSDTWLQCS